MCKIPKVILAIETSRAYGRNFLLGVVRYARLHGPWVFLHQTEDMQEFLREAEKCGANGVIMRDFEQYRELFHLHYPTIIIQNNLEIASDYFRVITDDKYIGQTAADHFISRGFKEFAFCGYQAHPWSRNRLGGFQQALAKEGYPLHFYQPQDPTIRWPQEQQFLAEWLMTLPNPIALFACNDDRGREVLETCKIAEIRVPEQIAVLGVDNDELLCELADPPLSSISLEVEKAGFLSAQFLDRMMKKELLSPERIVVSPANVIQRQSTNMIAVKDQDIASAIRYIGLHGDKPIRVLDVAAASGLSRRVLEKRFRHILRKTVYQQITQTRVEKSCAFLIETTLTIGQISYKLGFKNIEQFSRFFRREVGQNPLAWRREHQV